MYHHTSYEHLPVIHTRYPHIQTKQPQTRSSVGFHVINQTYVQLNGSLRRVCAGYQILQELNNQVS